MSESQGGRGDTAAPILSARGVEVEFRMPRGASGGRKTHRALTGVDLDLRPGEILGLVGESGSGKSTLARVLVGLQPPSKGTVLVQGSPVTSTRSGAQRRYVQMVFQDSHSALNPRMTVGQTLGEIVAVAGRTTRGERERRVGELLELVHLPARVAGLRPAQLSGGQRQRVGIARALALEPHVLIADEAVSALDVSVQAAILNLLLELRERLGLSVLFISHNLAVIRQVADRVVVMYLGSVVESSPADDFFRSPAHPYTAALLGAVPRLHGGPTGTPQAPAGEPSPASVSEGCAFAPRCERAAETCQEIVPPFVPVAGTSGWEVACHHPIDVSEDLGPWTTT